MRFAVVTSPKHAHGTGRRPKPLEDPGRFTDLSEARFRRPVAELAAHFNHPSPPFKVAVLPCGWRRGNQPSTIPADGGGPGAQR